MDTYVEKITLARMVAAERTTAMRKEPISLEQRGALLRSVLSGLSRIWEGLRGSLVMPTRELTFCTFNPSEC